MASLSTHCIASLFLVLVPLVLCVSCTPLTKTESKVPIPTPYPPFMDPTTAMTNASNPSLFRIFRTSHCTGSDTGIHNAQYEYHKEKGASDGKEGCYPLSFPWYSVKFEQAMAAVAGGQREGEIFTGGGCSRRVKASAVNGCHSFDGGEVITGVKM